MSEKLTPRFRPSDHDIRSVDAMCVNESELSHPWWYNFKYSVAGILFGIVLVKAEIVSWYRIQEMFRFQSFHMYGIIRTAVIIGVISVALIKMLGVKTIYGEPVTFQSKSFSRGQIYGGLLFGFGWALTGACPGPLYGLLGSGFAVFIVAILSALAGTYVYGLLREKLPH